MGLKSDKDYLLGFAIGHVYGAYIERLDAEGQVIDEDLKAAVIQHIYDEADKIRKVIDEAG